MKTIYFVTTNKGKVASVRRDLDGVAAVEAVGIELPEPRSDETAVIAREKVLQAFQYIKKPCIAQDGGFYIDSLNGFPKAYVNFAVGTIGLEGILKLVEGKDRSCEFRDALAYMDEAQSEPLLFETVTRGRLAEAARGELHEYNWGELHKIFIPHGADKTLAEMTESEMAEWRASRQDDWCGRKFAKWLIEYNAKCKSQNEK